MQQKSDHNLTEHPRGWVKTINGKTRWICSKTAAPTAEDADRIYVEKFQELWRAKSIPTTKGALLVRDLCNLWVDRQHQRFEAGEISKVSYLEYEDSARDFADAVGSGTRLEHLAPNHFADARALFASRFAAHRLSKWLILTRSMFKWAMGHPLRLRAPDYGDCYDLPKRKQFRVERAARGRQIFTADEIHLLLELANPAMRAVILLGVNCAFGQTDICSITSAAIHTNTSWIVFPRTKTAVPRRIPMWPETAAAISVLEHGKRLFGYTANGINANWRRLLSRAKGVEQIGFYGLRRTWRTWADNARDQRAAETIMGHVLGDVGSLYVDHVSDSRLIAVSNHVRSRLFTGYVEGIASAELLQKSRAAWLAQLSSARRARKPRQQATAPASDHAGPQDETPQ
jgi:integrase